MKIVRDRSLPHVAAAGFAAALAACAGQSQSLPASSAFGPGGALGRVPSASAFALYDAAHIVPMAHPQRGTSWMSKDAGKEWLAYSSDPNNPAGPSIDVYNYRDRTGKLFGQIVGPQYPYSQCLDDKGNVYVVDASTSNAKIYEYGHGSTSPIATAADAYGFPVGCAFNPVNGDLAVANIEGAGSGTPGGIDIFSGGLGGNQTFYTDYRRSGTYYFWPPGYDPTGNLYVQGVTLSGTPTLLEFSGGTFVTLHGLAIRYPGAVQWDGKYMSATDQAANYVESGISQSGQDQFTVSGSTATLVRQSILLDNCGSGGSSDVVQPALTGTNGKIRSVYAGNMICTSRNDVWRYDQGGEPKRTLPADIVPGTSFGQVVSPPSSP